MPSLQVTIFAPIGKNEPEAGVHVTTPQLLGETDEVVVGAAYVTTAPPRACPCWSKSFGWVMSPGGVMVQVGVMTFTVAVDELFALSLSVVVLEMVAVSSISVPSATFPT